MQRLAVGQGIFYVASGLWPLCSLRSFEMVTGRKDEPWLVKTVGLMLVAVGGGLIRSRKEKGMALVSLGRAPALALGGIDIWYAGVRRCISPVYLVDAAIQLGLAASWTVAARRSLQVPSQEAASPGGDLI